MESIVLIVVLTLIFLVTFGGLVQVIEWIEMRKWHKRH